MASTLRSSPAVWTRRKTAADLAVFGDYGKVLKENPQVHLAKTLAPPGAIHLSLKYRQIVPGMYEVARKSAQGDN